MSSNGRSEARSVILRLRRYRDRMQEIAAAAAGMSAAEGGGAIVVQRRLRSLRNDLDNDAHECDIGRKRMVQTDCELEFLWPALREAADAARSKPDMSSAQGRIEHYLAELEGRWPTL